MDHKYDIYIFDLDGTLLDTLDDLTTSVNHALSLLGPVGPTHCGRPSLLQRTPQEVRAMVGNGVRRLMERAVGPDCPAETMERALEAFRAHYAEHGLDKTRPYPGIIPLLKELKREGKKVAIVSNKFDAATKRLAAHFFGPLVQVAIGESETVRRKPAPDAVFMALSLLKAHSKTPAAATPNTRVGVPHEEPACRKEPAAVYIGDSDTDILTARAAGLPMVAVSWGFRDEEFLRQAGGRMVVHSPEQIP